MQNASFNIFDALTALVLLSSGVFAFRRGLVSEIMSLGTWVIATIFAYSFYPSARPLMQEQIQNELLADAATGLGLFCLAIIVLIPLGNYLNGFVKGPTLSSIDRSLGFVFGLIRGFVVMCLLFLVVSYIWPDNKGHAEEGKKKEEQPKWLAQSKTKPALAYGVELLKSLAPDGSEKALKETMDESREAADEAAENAKRLEEISVPVPAMPKSENVDVESYGESARDSMNEMIDRNSNQ